MTQNKSGPCRALGPRSKNPSAKQLHHDSWPIWSLKGTHFGGGGKVSNLWLGGGCLFGAGSHPRFPHPSWRHVSLIWIPLPATRFHHWRWEVKSFGAGMSMTSIKVKSAFEKERLFLGKLKMVLFFGKRVTPWGISYDFVAIHVKFFGCKLESWDVYCTFPTTRHQFRQRELKLPMIRDAISK